MAMAATSTTPASFTSCVLLGANERLRGNARRATLPARVAMVKIIPELARMKAAPIGAIAHAADQSGRITPDTPSKAPASSSQTSSRAGSTGPGMVARPLGMGLKPDLP